MLHRIYGLYSTKDGIIRYVGETTQSLQDRLSCHKCEGLTRKIKNHRCNWIRSVYKNGYEIKIVLLDTATEETWEDAEKHWISEYRERIGNLTNELDGGNSGGPGAKRKDYLSYDEARALMIENGIKTLGDYAVFYKKLKSEGKNILPASASQYYSLRGEWINSYHFFGKSGLTDMEKHENFLPYDDAKKLVNDLGIKTLTEYKTYIKASGNTSLPSHPERVYGNKWVNRYEFFEKEKATPLSYEEAKEFSIKNGFKTSREYFAYRKNNKNCKLPQHPERDYREWVSWADFLETNNKRKPYKKRNE